MTNNNKNIDKIIKEKFEDFQASPPSYLWRNIKGSIAGGSSLLLIYKFLGTPLGTGITVVTGVTVAILGYNIFTGDREISPDVTINIVHKTIEAAEYPNSDDKSTSPDSKTSPALADMVKNEIMSGERSTSDKNTENLGDEELTTNVRISHDQLSEPSLNNDQIIGNNTDKLAHIEQTQSIEPEQNITVETYLETADKITVAQNEYPEIFEIINQADEYEVMALNEQASVFQNISIDMIVIKSIPYPFNLYEPSALTSTSASDSALFAPAPPLIQLKDDYGKRSDLSFGILYTPEKVFYPERSNQFSNTIELNGILYFDNFILQSGLGMSLVKDLCDYNVNYNSFEIVGSYYAVDSLVFDPVSGNPTYYTTLQNVFDSVNNNCESNTINKYTYLRIPLIVGYRKEFKRISYFIKGGTALNILLKNTEPDPIDFPNDIAIQHIDRQTPGRIKTYWQLYMGVGITYQISQRLGVLLEPTASYNLSNVYNRNYLTGKRPYSIGFKTGIIFSL